MSAIVTWYWFILLLPLQLADSPSPLCSPVSHAVRSLPCRLISGTASFTLKDAIRSKWNSIHVNYHMKQEKTHLWNMQCRPSHFSKCNISRMPWVNVKFKLTALWWSEVKITLISSISILPEQCPEEMFSATFATKVHFGTRLNLLHSHASHTVLVNVISNFLIFITSRTNIHLNSAELIRIWV